MHTNAANDTFRVISVELDSFRYSDNNMANDSPLHTNVIIPVLDRQYHRMLSNTFASLCGRKPLCALKRGS